MCDTRSVDRRVVFFSFSFLESYLADFEIVSLPPTTRRTAHGRLKKRYFRDVSFQPNACMGDNTQDNTQGARSTIARADAVSVRARASTNEANEANEANVRAMRARAVDANEPPARRTRARAGRMRRATSARQRHRRLVWKGARGARVGVAERDDRRARALRCPSRRILVRCDRARDVERRKVRRGRRVGKPPSLGGVHPTSFQSRRGWRNKSRAQIERHALV